MILPLLGLLAGLALGFLAPIFKNLARLRRHLLQRR